MTVTWQNLTALLIVLLAVGYLCVYLTRWLRRKGLPVCGCCRKKCPAETSETPLIDLRKRS